MSRWNCCVSLFFSLLLASVASAQQASAPSSTPSKAPAKKSAAQADPATPPKPDQGGPSDSQDAAPDPDVALQLIVRQAGNDPAMLVKGLQGYLTRYPDSPRRGPIYRALLEAEMTLRNPDAALDYAEKVIEIQPEDSQSMYAAVTLLEKKPDDASHLRAVDYDTKLIERVSKADPETRPQNMTLDDWQAGRNKFMADLYVVRGRLQHHLKKNDEAEKDLNVGFRLLPSAEAAVTLGEIAEENRKADEAIRDYATAFALAGQESQDDSATPVDREVLRQRMGNLWRFSHDSNAGLGDVMLTAYDKSRSDAKAEKADAPVYNKGVSDPMQFSLRPAEGGNPVKLSDSRGKVIVLNFWTTWCSYCTQLETMLASVRTKYSGRSDVIFLTVNADQDETAVTPFLQQRKPGGTLVFSDGVAEALKVESIPTVIVLDKSGKIVYRAQGFAPDGFAEQAARAIAKAGMP